MKRIGQENKDFLDRLMNKTSDLDLNLLKKHGKVQY